MGLMFRRRRPIARLAVGAATAGVAYHAGQRRAKQDQYNAQASAAYDATQYTPPPPAPTPGASSGGSNLDELNQLVGLHTAGVLSDAEFAAAKGKLLGL